MSTAARIAADLIARAHVRIEDEIGRRGIKLRGTVERCGPCPKCGGVDRFSINVNKQVWNCRGCGTGGDVIALVRHLDECDFRVAVETLTGDVVKPQQIITTPTSKRSNNDDHERKQRQLAAWLWSQRCSIEGTIAECYLRARGYFGVIPPTIGFLPPGENYPAAMISAYATPNEMEPGELGAPLKVEAVHLTRLLADGSDRVREQRGKITIGRPLGRPIAVSSITDGLSLVLTEGIEDALAYAAAGFAAWAVGSAPYFPSIVIPDFITSVIIEAHPGDAAKAGIETLLTRLRAQPVRPGERPLEVLLREACQ